MENCADAQRAAINANLFGWNCSVITAGLTLSYRGDPPEFCVGIVGVLPTPFGDRAMSRTVIASGVALLFVIAMDSPAGEPIAGAGSDQRAPIYDADASHLWNRLHGALWVRTDQEGNKYGSDLLNPLFWQNTKFLVEGDSHRQALKVLDEFLSTRGERRF